MLLNIFERKQNQIIKILYKLILRRILIHKQLRKYLDLHFYTISGQPKVYKCHMYNAIGGHWKSKVSPKCQIVLIDKNEVMICFWDPILCIIVLVDTFCWHFENTAKNSADLLIKILAKF